MRCVTLRIHNRLVLYTVAEISRGEADKFRLSSPGMTCVDFREHYSIQVRLRLAPPAYRGCASKQQLISNFTPFPPGLQHQLQLRDDAARSHNLDMCLYAM